MSFTEEDKINRKIELKRKELSRKQIKKQLGRNGYGKYTIVETEMITSNAFATLNGTAKNILMLFLLKRKGWDFKKGKAPEWKNPDQEISMTWKELQNEPFNFHPEQIRRNFKILLCRGFIKIMYKGGAYKKDKNIYGLSNNWRIWSLGQDFSPKKKQIKRGFQGRGFSKVKDNPDTR